MTQENRPYADLTDQDLAARIDDMKNTIDGMARMSMGTAHESRILGVLKKEETARAA